MEQHLHQLISASCSCGGELFSDAQFQQYMGTYILQHKHSCTSSSPAGGAATCSSGAARLLHPAAGGELFRVPALHCSFPLSLHPEYETMKEQCDGWIEEVAQPPSAAARQLLLDCVLPRLICRNIPSAPSITRLIHVAKMVAWLTIADDDDDHPDALGADDVTTAHHASRVLSILRRDPLHAHVEEDLSAISIVSKKRSALMVALASLWADMRREMSPLLCSRFISTMEDYLDAVKVQATYRKAKRLPDMQAYTEIRRHASFIPTCFVLVEYALGIELDDATYANASIQEFRNSAMDYICLCNDLISCKMEREVGDYFNMPSIVYASYNNQYTADHDQQRPPESCTLQAAVDCVADMAHDLDARCASMLQSMLPKQAATPTGSPSPSDQAGISSGAEQLVRTYLSGLCSSMSGSLAWFLETARYAS